VQYIIRPKDSDSVWANIANELKAAPIEFHPTDQRTAELAANFKARFKLSLIAAFAAALAKERKTELVTGNPGFKPLEKEMKINWLK
jgi:predicted nucleic acid-binding protein